MLVKNLLSLVFASALALTVSYCLNTFSPIVSKDWLYSLLFLATLFFILNLVYSFRVGSHDFTELLIASLSIKLLVALVIVFIYSLRDKAGFFAFAIHFIIQYVLFSIFEIRYLLQLIKNNTHKNNAS